MKLILKRKKLKTFIEKKVDSIKINNLENRLFSEEDLIREVEKEKSNFINKKFGLFSRIVYKTLDIINLHDLSLFNIDIENHFNENVIKVLKNSKSIKEFERILDISKKDIINIQDFQYLFKDELIISFMFDRGFFNKEDIVNMIQVLKNKNDHKNISKKEISDSLNFLKNIINCKD